MKHIGWLLVTTLFFCLELNGQSAQWEEFNLGRLERNRHGMLILGSWAASNMAISALALRSPRSGIAESFHQMNIGWNAVNLIIAGFGYYDAQQSESLLTLSESLQEHEKIKQILLFNAGLDLAYIAGGFYLRERAKSDLENSDRWEGFGRAVIMNGAFLFSFDLIKYILHQRAGASDLYPLLEKLQVGPQGVGFIWQF